MAQHTYLKRNPTLRRGAAGVIVLGAAALNKSGHSRESGNLFDVAA